MRQSSDSDMKVGTSAPGDDLHVYGHSMTVEDPDSSDDAAYILQVNSIRQWAESGSAADHPYGHAYWIYDFVAGAVRMLIDDVGNVGIGTEDPQANLHVYDSGNSGVRINGGTEGYLQLGSTNGFALIGTDNNFYINRDIPLGTGAGTVFSLDASGNMDVPGDVGANTATIANDLTMTAGNINMAAGALVDGVDVSELAGQVDEPTPTIMATGKFTTDIVGSTFSFSEDRAWQADISSSGTGTACQEISGTCVFYTIELDNANSDAYYFVTLSHSGSISSSQYAGYIVDANTYRVEVLRSSLSGGTSEVFWFMVQGQDF